MRAKALFITIVIQIVFGQCLPLAEAVSKPDLAILDLRVNAKCQIIVKMANLGQGKLPDYMYDALNGTI
ncbi:MAG: hypothetical protein D6726_12355, partial [Nitrospirae bacterium]